MCHTASTTVSGAPTVTGINGELSLGREPINSAPIRHCSMSYGDKAYVVNSGVRMPIDLSDRAVTEALGIKPGGAGEGNVAVN